MSRYIQANTVIFFFLFQDEDDGEANQLDESEVECSVCLQKFYNISIHRRVSHLSERNSVPEIHRCLTCGFLAPDSNILTKHLVDHR